VNKRQLLKLRDGIVRGDIKATVARSLLAAEAPEAKPAAAVTPDLDLHAEQTRSITKVPVEVVRPTGGSNMTRELVTAMKEKRAITLNGTGAVSQISEIAKELTQKTPVLKGVRYFYGSNAMTNIPVLSPTIATPANYAEGATAIGNDTQAVLSAKVLTPYAYVSILPVSAEALQLSEANIEGELNSIFADAFAKAMHTGVVVGNGSGRNMTGAFVGVPQANVLTDATTGMPKIADLVKLALQIQDYTDEGVIIMSPVIYAGIMQDTTTTSADVYKETLVRDKSIEGVKILVTGAAPSATASGSIVAVAGRLQDYGVAIAAELAIDPIKKVGDTNTYFQATMFFNGAPIVPANWYGLAAL